MKHLKLQCNYFGNIITTTFYIFSNKINLKKLHKNCCSGIVKIDNYKSCDLEVTAHEIDVREHPKCDTIVTDINHKYYIGDNSYERKKISGKEGYYLFKDGNLLFDTVFAKESTIAYTLTFKISSNECSELELLKELSDIIENTYASAILQSYLYKRKVFLLVAALFFLIITHFASIFSPITLILLLLYAICYTTKITVLYNNKTMLVKKTLFSKFININYKSIKYVVEYDYDSGRGGGFVFRDMQTVATKIKKIFLMDDHKLIQYDAHTFILDHPDIFMFENSLKSHNVSFISYSKWRKTRKNKK